MKKKRRAAALILIFSVAILSGMFFRQKMLEEERIRQELLEQERIRQELIQQEEKKSNCLKLINQAFEEHIKHRKLTASEDFAEWFYEHYLENEKEQLFSFVKDTIPAKTDFYQETGESLFVLTDRFLGLATEDNHIYERTGKTPGQAEITIAGDLCFAEDGYVLDHYDTVKDLSKCISPYLLKTMNETDVFYLNHEFCVSDRGTPMENKYYTFRAKPSRMKLLEEMSVDLAALANNHVYDYGPKAMLDTTDHLLKAGIPYVGGGKNLEEATEPVYFIVNGLKIGFVGASNAEKYRLTPQATNDSPGILRAYDTTLYNKVIKKAARQCDYLIAYIHWGTEDSNYLNDLQQKMGREFLKSGADIVVGGHPHVLQGMEYVDGKPIIYSLGDFWFNKETKYTGLLQLRITPDGLKEMNFVPCLQKGFTTRYLDKPKDQEKLYDFLENLSVNVKIDESGFITEKE